MTQKSKIPEGWDLTTIGKTLYLKSGEFLSTSDTASNGKYPIYGGNGISGYHSTYLFEERKIVIGRVGAKCGAVHYTLPNSWITDNALYVAKKDKGFLDEYLEIALRFANLNQYANQSGQPLISSQRIKDVPLLMPPIEEQRRIVAVLDEKLTAVSQARQAAKAQLEAAKALPAVYLRTIFDGPKAQNWPFAPLGELISIISGRTFEKAEYSLEGVRLLQIANVGFQEIAWNNTYYLPYNYLERYPHLVLKEGDLLLALNRPILGKQVKFAILTDKDAPAILYQRVGKVEIHSTQIMQKYLYTFLHTEYFYRELKSRLQGSDQPYINPTALIRIKIPVPPVKEQEAIAHIFLSKQQQSQKLIETISVQLGLINTLPAAYLRQAFNGEL